MPLLYSDAKKILSKFAGKGGYCPDGSPVDLFVREVLQYMLYEGGYGNEKKFCFVAEAGCITLPHELEVPLRVKVDGEVGSVWDKWFEFHSTSVLEDCVPADTALVEDPNYYPTVYSMPNGGAKVGVTATTSEATGSHIIILGKDPTGRQIYTFYNGEQISGERLDLCWGELRHTQSTFGEITGVIKTPTNGYVNLYWHQPDPVFMKGFLSSYSPLEETPQYRKFKFTKRCRCSHAFAKVSVIGRIRLKDRYADNDFIPFDNVYALSMAGQTVNANYKDKVDVAVAKSRVLKQVVTQENAYKKVNTGSSIDTYRPLSGGSIKRLY